MEEEPEEQRLQMETRQLFMAEAAGAELIGEAQVEADTHRMVEPGIRASSTSASRLHSKTLKEE